MFGLLKGVLPQAVDPGVVYGARSREITLENFDGAADVTLRLPADDLLIVARAAL